MLTHAPSHDHRSRGLTKGILYKDVRTWELGQRVQHAPVRAPRGAQPRFSSRFPFTIYFYLYYNVNARRRGAKHGKHTNGTAYGYRYFTH